MKVTILRDSLLDKVVTINRICPKKSDLSILNFFKLKTEEGKLKIYTTDLEIAYQAVINAKTKEESEFLIPAKPFLEVLQNFYEDEITLENKENVLIIRGEKSFSSLPGISEEDYPNIPEYSTENYLEIDNKLFEDYLEKIYDNIKTANIIKPELAGVLIWILEDYIRLVTTDTIRLSEIKFKKDLVITNIDKELKILIPGKIISEYLKIRKKPLKLRIFFEKAQVTFDLDNEILITKLLTIDYPDYQQVIPQSFDIEILVNREEALKALRLNKVFVDQAKELKITLDSDRKILEFYTKNELMGESKNEVNIEILNNNLEQNKIEISYNLDFLMDGIKNIDSEKIYLGINTASEYGLKPTLIKSPLEEDFIYILMPI